MVILPTFSSFFYKKKLKINKKQIKILYKLLVAFNKTLHQYYFKLLSI